MSKKEVEDRLFRSGLALNQFLSCRWSVGGRKTSCFEAHGKGHLPPALATFCCSAWGIQSIPAGNIYRKTPSRWKRTELLIGGDRMLVVWEIWTWSAGFGGHWGQRALGTLEGGLQLKSKLVQLHKRQWVLTELRKMQCQTTITCIRTTEIHILHLWHFLK